MPKSSTVFSIVDTAGGYRAYRRAVGWVSRNACPRSRPTVRPACGFCPVIVDDRRRRWRCWACLPTTAEPASGRTSKRSCSSWSETGDSDVRECLGDGSRPPRRYSCSHSDNRRRRWRVSTSCASNTCCWRSWRVVAGGHLICRSDDECLTRRWVVGNLTRYRSEMFKVRWNRQRSLYYEFAAQSKVK